MIIFSLKRNNKVNHGLFYISFFILLLVNFSFSLTKNSTMFADTEITELENNQISITARLIQFQVPESKSNLIDVIKKGEVEESLILGSYQVSPVIGRNVSVFLVEQFSIDNLNEKLVCTNTTDINGRFRCIVQLQNPNVFIKLKFFESKDFYGTELVRPVTITPNFPSFVSLIDSSWLIIFFILGVLAAAMYVAGRKPLDAFNITTPKVKGIKTPKVAKLKVKVAPLEKKVLIGFSALSSKVSGFYQKAKVDARLLKPLSVVEKYVPRNELKDVYSSSSDLDRNLLLIEIISKKGLRSKLINMLESSKRSLNSLQKAKEVTLAKKAKATKWQDLEKLSDREKIIQMKINEEINKIRQYERDLKSLSAEKLISIAGLENIDIVKLEKIEKDANRKIVSSLQKYIKGESKKINFEKIKEEAISSINSISPNREFSEKIKPYLISKIELDELYIRQINAAINKINSDPGAYSHKEWKIYQDLKIKQTNPKEMREAIIDLLKIYANSHQEEKEEISQLIVHLKETANARDSLKSSFEKFKYDYNKLKSEDIKTDELKSEKYAFNSLIDFNILIKKSNSYINELQRSDLMKYYDDELVLNPEAIKIILGELSSNQ